MKFVPARAEGPLNSTILKKVLVTNNDLTSGQIQMINWVRIRGHNSSIAHYHESLQEICFVLSRNIKLRLDQDETVLRAGDVVLINPRVVHQMWNLNKKGSELIAIGIAKESGKTVIV